MTNIKNSMTNIFKNTQLIISKIIKIKNKN